jgi:high-affinity iron transporter
MAAALLSFREGLEAALIVGIVLGYLNKVGQTQHSRSVWAGVFSAAGVSIGAALILSAVGAKLEGAAEEIFEGVTMLLAAAVLTWMIFWMYRHSRQIKSNLEARMRSTAGAGRNWQLFSLAFLAVVREGIELALFLTAATFATSAFETVAGGLLGLAAAVALGWFIFSATRRLNVQRFFAVSSLLLLIVAAGLVGHGIHELTEAGLAPAVVEHVWSTKAVLDDNSGAGSLLKALFGYNDDPSLIQVLAYAAYAVIVVAALALQGRRPPLRDP